MTPHEDTLRQSDPVVHEATPSAEILQQIRQRAERHARESSLPSPARSRRAAIVSMVVVGGLAVGSVVWQGTMAPTGVVEAAAVRLEVRLAESTPQAGLIPAVVAGTRRVVYLHPDVLAGNHDILTADVDADGEAVSVRVTISAAAAARLRVATATHLGRPVAIVLDGQVVLAPIVASAFGDAVVISGRYTRAEADRIAAGLLRR